LNEDLAREYQAIIAYVVYSQVIKGAQYVAIAGELESHARRELEHALTIAKQIDYLGGMPTVTPRPVKTSEKAEVNYRLPVVLCYLEGKSYQAAAAQLRCPVGTIKGRLSSARQNLRDRLSRRGLDSYTGPLEATS
jgi:rubrerythrin